MTIEEAIREYRVVRTRRGVRPANKQGDEMPLLELTVKTIHQATPPLADPADTICIWDTDGRVIVIRRIQIPELIRKLEVEM